MATFEITAPDGSVYEIEGPDEQGALAALRKHLGSSQPKAVVPPADAPSGTLQSTGPGPGGFIDPALYEMGAIGRRFEQGPAGVQATKPESDVMESFGTGLVRGTTGLVDLPSQLPALVAQGGSWLGEKAGMLDPTKAQGFRQDMRDYNSSIEGATAMMTKAAPGVMGFEPQTTAGEYAQTVGEFLPATAGGGIGAVVKAGVAPALTSEAAGQATEGTDWEGVARIIGAVAAPVAAGGVGKMLNASASRPTIENLRATKTAAYKAVDSAGDVFTGAETTGLYNRVDAALKNSNYVAGVDKQTDAVVSLLARKAGSDMTLSQLDKIRQNLFKRYSAAPNEVDILDVIDEIDNMIASRAPTNELMSAARAANARYKKGELLDLAFQKAQDQTGSTGSGGNILNKYRQAVTSIINDPKKSKWFTQSEIDNMRSFVRGSMTQNTLRRFGKLSPNGNGLMLALNVGAVVAEPLTASITIASTAAKAAADRMAAKGAENVMRTVTGTTAAPRQGVNLGNIGRAGLSALATR